MLLAAVSAHAACNDAPAQGVDWRRCFLDRRSFAGVDLTAAVLRDASLQRADLSRARMAQVDAPDARFTSANMEGVDLSDAILRGADFTRTDLRNATLARADLRQARFFSANLTGADLTDALLAGADFNGANLSGARWADGRTCAQGSRGVCQ
jgi:uncharacterized protein YjbI with pentapeptide repeats